MVFGFSILGHPGGIHPVPLRRDSMNGLRETYRQDRGKRRLVSIVPSVKWNGLKRRLLSIVPSVEWNGLQYRPPRAREHVDFGLSMCFIRFGLGFLLICVVNGAASIYMSEDLAV